MGVQLCDCRATASGSGMEIVPIGPFNVELEYNIDITICPDCMLDGSAVTASFSADIPVIGTVTASLVGDLAGFPVCFEEMGNQVLEVEVDAELDLNGNIQPVSFTLTLNSSGQVCVDVTIGPITLPCLDLPVVITSC